MPEWSSAYERRKRNSWNLLLDADLCSKGWEGFADDIRRSTGQVVGAAIVHDEHFATDALSQATLNKHNIKKQ